MRIIDIFRLSQEQKMRHKVLWQETNLRPAILVQRSNHPSIDMIYAPELQESSCGEQAVFVRDSI